MEQSELFQLINKATSQSYHDALSLVELMPTSELQQCDEKQQNTFLHYLILRLYELHRHEHGDLRAVVPLIYKLALYGVEVNAQNSMGNTVLHLACFRPHGHFVTQHLVRIGVDPGILNSNNCRVIHHNAEQKCWMVRGQKSAKCSIWNAVAREDRQLIASYLRSWCRVNTRRHRKTLLDVAYETGNYQIVEQLLTYHNTNELVCCALACDKKQVAYFLDLKSDKCDPNTQDFSQEIAKPLLAELSNLGERAEEIMQLLRQKNFLDLTLYLEKLQIKEQAFTCTQFYNLVQQGTPESLAEAWQELHKHNLNVKSVNPNDGGTYLHFLVACYLETAPHNVHIKRLLIRLMAKLSIEGVDMHARNSKGFTALLAAYSRPPDCILLDHLIRLGVDAAIRSPNGLCLAVNKYAIRGELVLKHEHDRRYIPGLCAAVEDGDEKRVQYWLDAMCRVEVYKAGRTLLDLARDLGNQVIAAKLESYHHTCEFVAAAIASDFVRMKHYISLNQGAKKANTCFKNHFAGYTEDRRTETVVRPLIVSVMEYGTAEICEYLIAVGARLDVQYDEEAPCGPVAFWALRHEIQASISLAVVKHAALNLRNQNGDTLLHLAVLKRDSPENKRLILGELLSRGVNVAARNIDGITARDLCCLSDTFDGAYLRQMIDDYVLNLSYIGDIEAIEQLIVDGYDHILDIRGTARNKSCIELATLRYYKELIDLLKEVNKYQNEIVEIHQAVISNDIKGFLRLSCEKRVAWGVDRRGRNLLHLAVMFKRHALVAALCDQFPAMIVNGDNLLRTPVHYAVCLRDQRAILSIISTSNSLDMTAREANNMSVLDYVEQMERPTPSSLQTRGRRIFNYQVQSLLNIEMQSIKDQISCVAFESKSQ